MVVGGWAIVDRDVVAVDAVFVPVLSTDTVVVSGDSGTEAGVHEASITTPIMATNAPHLPPLKYLPPRFHSAPSRRLQGCETGSSVSLSP